ncbi:hypothetical protein ABLB69_00140 [Xenorhabdus khoisanae]|uniref:Uncharacterized protein n=1 Tax=Xenorhabdus khoisanae TaxID=880157 RepID=A0A0J5FYI1_9GAMM|nr:hypothetical protein [Xenorhabdus khoisanae]KMJ46987.1 hypothetical protein AB204_00370 [Xenorhabdus khoisanae]
MSSFNPALYKKTPAVNVLDNRSLTIREMGYHRAEANGVTDPRIRLVLLRPSLLSTMGGEMVKC